MIRGPTMSTVRRSRGSILLYAVAFGLLVAGAYLLFVGNTKSSLKLVWSSVIVCGTAMLVAVASVLFPRR